jgi:hypothetical protein
MLQKYLDDTDYFDVTVRMIYACRQFFVIYMQDFPSITNSIASKNILAENLRLLFQNMALLTGYGS